MSHQMLGRTGELAAIADFLTAACAGPTGLTIEGEAGIGKTTLWSAATEQARERGFQILSARAGQAEAALGYAAVADLLNDVSSAVFVRLPDLQRAAVDRVLLRSGEDGHRTDQRAVAVAFLAVVEALAADAPVLLAVDDVQWLDAPSRIVLTFAARRLKQRVGVLITERPEPDRETAPTWLSVGAATEFSRVRLGPLSLGGVRVLISERLGMSLPRPTVVRITEVSQGNPYYALELARAEGQSPPPEQQLPRALADLVRSRISDFDTKVHDVLLAAACATDPTVDLLAVANGTSTAETAELLETAENRGIVGIEGNRVRFTHPLLARGVYTDARPSRRRKMHRVLAQVEVLPEVKARHLALATTSEDPATLAALDAAAEAARARRAPADAAEFVDLAIRLGGDTPGRRIRSARYHFHAGNHARARTMLEPHAEEIPSGPLRAEALTLLAEMRMCHDSLAEAAELLTRTRTDAEGDTALLAHTLMLSALARIGTGAYDRSLEDARQAMTLSDGLDLPVLRSQANAVWVLVNFICGNGVDRPRLQRGLDLEVADLDAPVALRASTVDALLSAWTGRLDDALAQITAVRDRCIERAECSPLMFIDLHATMIAVWQGNFTEAAQIAKDVTERAEQLGSDHALVIADTVDAVLAAYAGREDEARTHAHAAADRANCCDSPRLADVAIMSLGLLEVSLGNYSDALTSLKPLLARLPDSPGTELMTAAFLPDAIEAMIALGRLDDAEPLIQALEDHGRRVHRAWTLATAARCRSMMLAAQGQLAAALRMAQQAMAAHQELPMLFERARTQLLLGQLQRRQRQKKAATTTLTEALLAFEQMDTALWAARTSSELARTRGGANRSPLLTPAEQRVAELAASGLTNRDIASTLFISPKTVEANLVRIYRKLGIHTRAELGRVISQQADHAPPVQGAQATG